MPAQCRQAAGGWPPAFAEAEQLFRSAENQIALLERCRPLDGGAAISAYIEAQRCGRRPTLAWRYRPAPDLQRLRGRLERMAQRLTEAGPIGALYVERAAELELEARLAEHVGHASFRELARQRHAERPSAEWGAARQLAAEWAALPLPAEACPSEPRYASDDRRAQASLYGVLARAIGQRRLPLRLEVVAELGSRAACGDGVIFVGTGHFLSSRESRRVALHELLGHALPRLAARGHGLGLLRVGSAASSDDEEGRALAIEAEHDLLEDVRRRELGLRHLVAVAVAGGADAEECLARLGQLGCASDEALAIYARVARGGGLCRELEYLPAWLRFAAARDAEPAVAAWLARGRVSLAAARVLVAEGVETGRE